MQTPARNYGALVAFLNARARTPFGWGSSANDCVSHGAGAVQAQTGRDILAELGVSWRTERQAAKALARFGGLEAAVDQVLTRLDGPALAHRGDIGLVEIEGRKSLAVFEGAWLKGPGLEGHVWLPREQATCAWSADQ